MTIRRRHPRPAGLSARSRTAALLLAPALLLGAALAPSGLQAAEGGTWRQVEAVRAVIGEAELQDGGLELDIPLMSENGAAVPVAVRVAQAADDPVEVLHLFAPANPTPQIATFHFGPQAGRAEVQLRVRLNESQPVIAVARLRSGAVRVAERPVQITTVGCLAPSGDEATETEMQPRVRLPDSFRAGEPGEVLTLITHPMETGLRDGPDGTKLPKRIIERFEARLDGEAVLTAELNRSVSANPYLRFFVAPRGPGELSLEWVEDTGRRVVETARVTAS